MAGKSYYITPFADRQRHAQCFAQSHWIARGDPDTSHSRMPHLKGGAAGGSRKRSREAARAPDRAPRAALRRRSESPRTSPGRHERLALPAHCETLWGPPGLARLAMRRHLDSLLQNPESEELAASAVGFNPAARIRCVDQVGDRNGNGGTVVMPCHDPGE